MYPKAVIVRSKPYLRWVASLACAGCGIEGFSQAAHANYGKGMAMKTCDTRTFPLCGPHWGRIGCHAEHDLRIDMTRDDGREREDRYTSQTRRLAIDAGRTELRPT
jgi:hypothetical protein